MASVGANLPVRLDEFFFMAKKAVLGLCMAVNLDDYFQQYVDHADDMVLWIKQYNLMDESGQSLRLDTW